MIINQVCSNNNSKMNQNCEKSLTTCLYVRYENKSISKSIKTNIFISSVHLINHNFIIYEASITWLWRTDSVEVICINIKLIKSSVKPCVRLRNNKTRLLLNLV